MNAKANLAHLLDPERTKPALITGLVLFFASYAFDLLLFWMAVPAAATVLNDIAIGILGALLLLFYLSSLRTEQTYRRAKEKMALVYALNHHVRIALTDIRSSADIDDRTERLRSVDEALDRIDYALLNLLPTGGGTHSSRHVSTGKN